MKFPVDETFTQREKLSSGARPGALRLLSALAMTAAFTLSGCEGKGGVDSFCSELPTARNEVGAFRSAIAAHVPSKGAGGRRIASTTEEPSVETRLGWLEWTEKALKKTQWARDALEHEKGTRKAMPVLSDASLSLVSIHGFIEQRKWGKASSELEKVDGHLARASELLCSEKGQARTAAAAQAEAEAERAAADRRPASVKKAKKAKKR
jgi:hypothetical protein